MLTRVTQFVDRLRQVGIPVSTAEAIDSVTALGSVDWTHREQFRAALSSCLIKNTAHLPSFDILFDIFFPAHGTEFVLPDADGESEDILQRMLEALALMDIDMLERLISEAIQNFAGMEPGRAVAGRIYQMRVEQGLRLNDLLQRLAQLLAQRGMGPAGNGSRGGEDSDNFYLRIAREDASQRVAELKKRIERQIRALLVADRGPEAVARTLVRELPEDIDFLQASSADLQEMRQMVAILARRLATRLAYKHHQFRKGRLDFRRTFRRSLETGGTPMYPQLKHRVRKPEIALLCDLSGSVAAFSRFALALLYTLSQHFGKVRSFAFVDTCDEVTRFFEGSDFQEAVDRIRKESKIIWMQDSSDYGHTLQEFVRNYADALTPRTSVLILGDCRSNYGAPGVEHLKAIGARARKVFILNPESRRYWNTGDSIVAKYEHAVDGVYECRNLRELSNFIERIG